MTASARQMLPSGPAEHLVFSDGLASVSVFIQIGRADGSVRISDDAATLGTSSAYSTVVAGLSHHCGRRSAARRRCARSRSPFAVPAPSRQPASAARWAPAGSPRSAALRMSMADRRAADHRLGNRPGRRRRAGIAGARIARFGAPQRRPPPWRTLERRHRAAFEPPRRPRRQRADAADARRSAGCASRCSLSCRRCCAPTCRCHRCGWSTWIPIRELQRRYGLKIPVLLLGRCADLRVTAGHARGCCACCGPSADAALRL